jgi:5-methylthioribose kinase
LENITRLNIEEKMALDIEQLEALIQYLRQNNHINSAEQVNIKVLAGGVSNRTVLVEKSDGEAWVIKQALEKLRVKVDWFSSPERIRFEARGLKYLAELAPPNTTTPLVFEDFAQHLLAMQAVPQPHENWKTLLLAGQVDNGYIEQFGRLLGTIHRNSYLRRVELSQVFEDQSFFESLRIEPYYSYTASQKPQAAKFIEKLIADTRATRLTVVHGDYSPKNILVYQGKLILLDHEVVHFGDPAFDLGFSITHLLSKAHHLAEKWQEFTKAANLYWQVYLETLGDLPWKEQLGQRAVRHTLGCLLARVAGRSPLEYLNETEKATQARVVLELMENTPTTLPELITRFSTRLYH